MDWYKEKSLKPNQFELSVADRVKKLNPSQLSEDIEPSPDWFDKLMGDGFDGAEYMHDKVWNLIAPGAKSEQESEVYIALLTLRKLICDRKLDRSLLRVLGESVGAAEIRPSKKCKDMSMVDQNIESSEIPQAESTPTGVNIMTIPKEIQLLIIENLITTDQRDEIELAYFVTMVRPDHHALLLTCYDFYELGIGHYHKLTELNIGMRGLEADGPRGWRRNRTLATKIIVESQVDVPPIAAAPEFFPNLKHLEWNLKDPECSDDLEMLEIYERISWHVLRSQPGKFFTTEPMHWYLGGGFLSRGEFDTTLDTCRKLRLTIPNVSMRYRMYCDKVECLANFGIEHTFQAVYRLKFGEVDSFHMEGEPI